MDKPLYHVWAAYAFEAVCYKHIQKIIQALGLVSAESVSTWRTNKVDEQPGVQIDLLIERNDNAITLCEIKYTCQPFTINASYLKNLQTKREVFKAKTKTQKQIFMVIISANGLKEDIHSSTIIDGVVTLEDLF